MNFEEAMDRLEAIVEQMESGELALEEILSRYEEGTRLVRQCSARLTDAGKRIELIARNAAGEPEVVEFDPASVVEPTAEPVAKRPRTTRTPKTSPTSPDAGEAGDVSLF